jgi:hypothetical protein
VESVSEDAVFEAIRDRVRAGDYLDWRHVEAPRGLVYQGSAAYLSARREGLLEPLPILVPAPAEAVEEAEGVIGFPLPPLLRRLYLQVADGGFGPHEGLLKLAGDHDGRTALGLYRHAHETSPLPFHPDWSFLPPRLLSLCSWGCGIYSFIDCSDPQGPMWGWDPNPGPGGEQALFPEPFVLAEWLARWLAGTHTQPLLIEDPVTGQWRGARDEDYARF